MFDINKILVISSHTDDAEISMGGSIHKFIENGYDVYHAILSSAEEQAIMRGYDPQILKNESKIANECLGLKSDNYYLFDVGYPTDYFYTVRQNIADSLNRLKLIIEPDIVFVHSSFDTHQDHIVVHNETKRIFKEIGVIGYEFPYNNLSFKYDLIIGLTEKNMETKIRAIRSFKSQHDRVYTDKEYIYSLARSHSVRIKSAYKYAEAFEVIRLIC